MSKSLMLDSFVSLDGFQNTGGFQQEMVDQHHTGLVIQTWTVVQMEIFQHISLIL